MERTAHGGAVRREEMMRQNHYLRLLVMTGLSFASMYVLMYADRRLLIEAHLAPTDIAVGYRGSTGRRH